MGISVLTRRSTTASMCSLTSLFKYQATFRKFPKAQCLFPNASSSQFFASPYCTQQQSQSQSEYRKQISLANLLQRYGFSPSQLQSLFAQRKSISQLLLNSHLSPVEKSLEILLSSFKLPHDLLVSMISTCPGVLELDFLKKWEVGILGLLGASHTTSTTIRSVLEFSKRFQIDPFEFYRSVQVLKGLGFTDCTISRILEEFPRVVMINERELQKRTAIMAVIGLDRDDINQLYSIFPGILRFGVEDRLKPLLDEFSQLGFSRNLLRQQVVREPRILTMELGELRQCLELLKKLKCRVPTIKKIFSEGEFKAGFAVKLRVDCLCSYGLIRRDALNVLRREPRIIIFHVEDIVKKIEFLLQRMKIDIGCLIDVPEYLGVNLDKQIIPRYNVIKYLRSKDGLGFEVGLKDLIKPSTLKFYNLYVKPYPECEKIFGNFPRAFEANSRHPIGLWKLLKPLKYEESKDDVKNISCLSCLSSLIRDSGCWKVKSTVDLQVAEKSFYCTFGEFMFVAI
ncbi:hypothetical protein Nepgr_033406 [Nepenthes gracilis]|uniref:Uncharacterized protein n=1 Tax=Nepenthes gracilis TaxID=150966 RepID=A0AAD3TMK3_NEPGR|nr:hypothetical protein Nepgr_033406 [Nepenthes gracilis]